MVWSGTKNVNTHTHTPDVNSQCNESSSRTGSHGVPAGEAESTHFWNLQMAGPETGRGSLRKAKTKRKTNERGVVGRGNRHSKTETLPEADLFTLWLTFRAGPIDSMMWTDSKINLDKLFGFWRRSTSKQDDWGKHLPESHAWPITVWRVCLTRLMSNYQHQQGVHQWMLPITESDTLERSQFHWKTTQSCAGGLTKCAFPHTLSDSWAQCHIL